jgi:hypothetical protein
VERYKLEGEAIKEFRKKARTTPDDDAERAPAVKVIATHGRVCFALLRLSLFICRLHSHCRTMCCQALASEDLVRVLAHSNM